MRVARTRGLQNKMENSYYSRDETSLITRFWTAVLQKRYIIFSLLFFVILRVFLVLIVNNSVQHWSDAATYVNCSHKSIIGLIFCDKPPVYPFLIKAFSYNLDSLIIFQAFFSSFSWVFFSFVLSRFFNSTRHFAFLVFYLISLNTQILQWDYIVLSDGVSFALFALTISFILLYALYKKRSHLYVSMFLFVPFALVRYSNVLVIFSVVVSVLVFNLKNIIGDKKVRGNFITLLLFFFLLFFSLFFYIKIGAADSFVLKNLLLDVASDDVYYNKLLSKGFPSYAIKCAGKRAWDPCLNEIPDFNEWVEKEGRAVYLNFIVTTPAYVLRTLRNNYVPSIVGDVARYGYLEDARLKENSIFPNLIGDTSYYRWTVGLMDFGYYFTFSKLTSKFEHNGFVISVLLLIALMLVLFKLRANAISYPLILFLMIVFLQFLVVFMDPSEIVRHLLLAAISINYLAVYLAFVIVDWLVNIYQGSTPHRKNNRSL